MFGPKGGISQKIQAPRARVERAGQAADLAIFPIDPQPIVGGAAAECDRLDRAGWHALSAVVAAWHVSVDPAFQLIQAAVQFADLGVATVVC